MPRQSWPAVFAAAFGASFCALSWGATAAATACDIDNAWKRVREAHPIHVQLLAQCTDPASGKILIVLTEPPSHIVRTKAEAIVQKLFASPDIVVERRRHPLGFDGWVEDLIIVFGPKSSADRATVANDLALLSVLAFGSTYKVEAEDISRLVPPSPWRAPKALEVSKAELFAWLLGNDAQKLVPVDGGVAATLLERVNRGEFGTYLSSSPGLVVTLMPRQAAGLLNDHIEELRRFVVDSDAFLGAIKVNATHVALVGRERTTSLGEMP